MKSGQHIIAGLLLVFANLYFAGHSNAQTASSQEVKSAYLIAFPTFFTWPDEASFNQFVIGVYGDDRVLIDSLRNGARNRSIRGKRLVIKSISDLGSMDAVQVLFVTSSSRVQLSAIASAVRRTDTLIVSDNSSNQIHSMINLVQTAENTIVFEVNKQNIVYENLRMDNDILLLGGTELDVAELLVTTEIELEKGRSELQGYETRVLDLQAEVDRQNNVIDERRKAADEANRSLAATIEKLDASEQELSSNQVELSSTRLQLAANSQSLEEKTAELNQREQDSRDQALLITSNSNVIKSQEAQILNQSEELQEQLSQLGELGLTLSDYQAWNRIILGAMFAIICLVIIAMYFGWQKVKMNVLLSEQNVALRKAKIDLQHESARADMASKAKGQFLANMSHEIRTPMTAILGYSELLQKHQADRKMQHEFIDAIRRSSGHLLSLINDVLDISKIEAGKAELNVESVDLQSIVYDIQSMFKLEAENKGLGLTFDTDAEVPRFIIADGGKIKQILVNLVGNAVKFTARGKVLVEVNADSTERDEQCKLIFRVTDEGGGIEVDRREEIFGAFEQIRYGLSKPGSGLGLAISRQFARLMKGDITVTSEVGRGSVFTCELPVTIGRRSDIKHIGDARDVVAVRGDKQDYRILVVDDNTDNRKLILEMLNVPGFLTAEATDGVECIEQTASWHPDLILLDLSMPRMTGEQTLSIIKSESAYEDIKVIVLTANAFQEQRELAEAAGADGFLSKPFKRWDILAAIAEQLEIVFEFEAETAIAPAKRNSTTRAADATSVNNVKMRKISPQLLGQFKRAITALDRDAIKSLIRDTEEIDGEIANNLQRMVDELQYEKVEALVESLVLSD